MTNRATRDIMGKLEHFSNNRLPHSCFEILSKHLEYQKAGDWGTVLSLLPLRFFLALTLTFIFVMMYFVTCCTMDGNGRWVSRAVHTPAKVNYSLHEFFLNALLSSIFPL